MSPFIFWPCFAGALFFVAGLLAIRKDLSQAIGLDKLAVLGRVFFAAPLAVFGAEHLAGAKIIAGVVPTWMPAPLFWTYLVGIALVCAAISILSMKYVRVSATLVGCMFFLFVLMIHLPNALARPGDRFFLALALRDLSFGAGAWALAGSQYRSNKLIAAARAVIVLAVVVFGVEHLLHPEFVPGVPLSKRTPDWILFRKFWGYPTGVVMLLTGPAMLVKKQARTAANLLGLWIAVLLVLIYVPILAWARGPAGINEGLNYIADTMLFGGAILLLAAATPKVHD